MIDKKEIISLQLLEQYALGTLSAELIDAVEEALLIHEDLREHLDEIEYSLEKIALENATKPPSIVKTKFLNSIADKKIGETTSRNTKKSKNYKWLVAASIIGLLALAFAWQYNTSENLKQELKTVEVENELIRNDLESLTQSFNDTEELAQFFNNPETERVVLKGNEKSPNSAVVSYFNNTRQQVLITTDKLQPLPENQDYQMWADVKGEMINMGIIDTNKALLAMNYIPEAESFNITIEPKGGSDHPNVSQLIANTYLTK